MTFKVLCICDWGQTRSAALAIYIHELNGKYHIDKLKYEAIAIGSVVSSKKTMKYFKKWADLVIDVRKYIPDDTWHNSRNDDLRELVKQGE